MKTLTFIACVMLSFVSIEGIAEEEKGALWGMVIIIDPGHGRGETGAQVDVVFEDDTTIRLTEVSFVNELACLIKTEAEKQDAIILSTRRIASEDCIDENLFAHLENRDVPVVDVESVKTWRPSASLRRRELERRVSIAQNALASYTRHRIVFLSIHFESGDPRLPGAHFIVPNGRSVPLADYLVESFAERDLLRQQNGETHLPIIRSGSAANGVPNFIVLRENNNKVRQSVLVEPANLRNKRDVLNLLDPKKREQFAELILESLYRTNELFYKKVRD